MASQPNHSTQQTDLEIVDIDPIWTSSRTARQIYALGEVEKVRTGSVSLYLINHISYYLKDISRLLALAASSISLLTLPQTDGPEDGLPQGGERSEQFVLEVSEYFERLDVRPLCLGTTRTHIDISYVPPPDYTYRNALLARPHTPITHRALRHQRSARWLRPTLPRRRSTRRTQWVRVHIRLCIGRHWRPRTARRACRARRVEWNP